MFSVLGLFELLCISRVNETKNKTQQKNTNFFEPFYIFNRISFSTVDFSSLFFYFKLWVFILFISYFYIYLFVPLLWFGVLYTSLHGIGCIDFFFFSFMMAHEQFYSQHPRYKCTYASYLNKGAVIIAWARADTKRERERRREKRTQSHKPMKNKKE